MDGGAQEQQPRTSPAPPSGEGPLVPPVSNEAAKKTEAERKTERKAKATETFSATLQTQALEKFGNGQDKAAAIAAVDTQAEEAWKNQRRNGWTEQEGTLQAEIVAATNGKGEEEKKAIATRLRQEKEAQWRKDWANSLAGTNPEGKYNADIYKNKDFASDPILQKLGFTGTKQDLATFLEGTFYREYCGKGGTQKLADKLMEGINIEPDADDYDAITALRQQIDASPLLQALYNKDATFQAACMKLSVELRTSKELGVLDDLSAHAQSQENNTLRTNPDEQAILTTLGNVDADRAKIDAKIEAIKQAEIAKQQPKKDETKSAADEEEDDEEGRKPETYNTNEDIAREAAVWVKALHGTPEVRQALYERYNFLPEDRTEIDSHLTELQESDVDDQAASIADYISRNTFVINDLLHISHEQGKLEDYTARDIIRNIIYLQKLGKDTKEDITMISLIYQQGLFPKLGIDPNEIAKQGVNNEVVGGYQKLMGAVLRADLDPNTIEEAKKAYEEFCQKAKITPKNFDEIMSQWEKDGKNESHFFLFKEDVLQGYYPNSVLVEQAYLNMYSIVKAQLEERQAAASAGNAAEVSNNLTPADVLFEGAPGASGELFDKPGQKLNIADNPDLYKERIVLVRTNDGNIYAINLLRDVIDTQATETQQNFVILGSVQDTFDTLALQVGQQLQIQGIDAASLAGKTIKEIAAVREKGGVPIDAAEEMEEARRTGNKKISDIVNVYTTRIREAEFADQA